MLALGDSTQEQLRLPVDYEIYGSWEGIIYNTSKHVCLRKYVLPFYASSLSDHDALMVDVML